MQQVRALKLNAAWQEANDESKTYPSVMDQAADPEGTKRGEGRTREEATAGTGEESRRIPNHQAIGAREQIQAGDGVAGASLASESTRKIRSSSTRASPSPNSERPVSNL
jgi:hypothetical protein